MADLLQDYWADIWRDVPELTAMKRFSSAQKRGRRSSMTTSSFMDSAHRIESRHGGIEMHGRLHADQVKFQDFEL